MKKILIYSSILATTSSLLPAATVFTGQNITLGHYLPDEATVFDGPFSTTVQTGVADLVALSPFADMRNGYTVNVEESSITIQFLDTVDFTAGSTFHGLIITDLSTLDEAEISGTGSFRSFSYDGSSLKLDWQGLTVNSGSIYNISFQAVPEPSSFLLLGAGSLMAMARRTRRRC